MDFNFLSDKKCGEKKRNGTICNAIGYSQYNWKCSYHRKNKNIVKKEICRCRGINKDGTNCRFKNNFGDYCKRHFDKLGAMAPDGAAPEQK